MPDQDRDLNRENVSSEKAPETPRQPATLADLLPNLTISDYAKMAIKAGIAKIELRYRGQVHDTEKDGYWEATERLQEGARHRVANTLAELENMEDSARNNHFIDGFRTDPDLVSGLLAFNQLVEHHRASLDQVLNDEWEISCRELQRVAAI
jgi:hypothetical protein